MPESGGLNAGLEHPEDPSADVVEELVAGSSEEELAGPDRGREHSALYLIIFALLASGSYLLRSNSFWASGTTTHSVMESVSTVLAFFIGALALVRFYSRKQGTFLLIGCGFLGAGLLDFNHALITSEYLLGVEGTNDLFAWSWTAERAFLSLYLWLSVLVWRQEMRGGKGEVIPEGSVYVMALVLTVSNLLFFERVSLGSLTFPTWFVSRPGELLPGLFFLLAFVGFYRKGSWRRDQFEHWMLVSLLISFLTHSAFMAFSQSNFDAMFDAAHLLKIVSYLAILTGLMSSVYVTFTREGRVLDALTESNQALAREVDFRSRTERAVKESSERLQAFLDNANDLIQSVSPGGRILYVNSSWKRVLGYADEDLERLNLFEIVHPAHRGELEAELARVLAGGPPSRFPVEYLAADGRVVILSGSSQVQLVNGQPVATQSILRDVTEQRLAEQRLDESQRNLEALVENTGDSIWSVDRDHRLITLNSAFALAMEARTGREPAVGQLPSAVFQSEDAEWYNGLYERTLSGERHVALRTENVDGHQRFFELYANPIQSIEGVSGAVFFGKDVTARERAEEALRVAKEEAEAANKAKSDFLANMSHELRTPLNSVIGFTNILLKNKDERLNEKDVGFLERVLSNGKHLLALINEVLDLAKVEAGRMELIIEEIDLAHLCVETVQQLEGQARAKGGKVRLMADVPDEVATVEADSAKLKQVIINLVGNALKFTEEGSVTVRLDMAPDGRTPTAICVADTGIGIPPDRLGAIFEAFQQAEAGTSRKYGGTGLGLALSRSISLLMGYDLIVESEVGKGSTFKIVMGERAARGVMLPEHEAGPSDVAEYGGDVSVPAGSFEEEESETVGDSDSPAPDTSGKMPSWSDLKVLVVDDERDSRVLITHFLEEFGCQVVSGASGEECLAMAREHRPDLITLDLIMPGMTGWEVLKRLKADPDLRTIPVVIVSVVAGEGRGRLLGAVDLVTKPFEREDLLRVLWRNLGRRRGGRVLLMVRSPEYRAELTTLIRDRGLEAVTSSGDGLFVTLGQEAPDALVLDLGLPGFHGVDALLELRDDRVHTGLPVLVLTHDGLNGTEREIVEELATVYSTPEQSGAALTRLLDAVFPMAAPEVSP